MNAGAPHKVLFKFGDIEFSAEGAVETCRSQFDDFMTFLRASGAEPRRPAASPQPAARENGEPREQSEKSRPTEDLSCSDRTDQVENGEIARLRGLFHEDDRDVISLRRKPDTETSDRDGLLLLLLGYRLLRSQRSVPARALMLGARQSGIKVKDRVSSFLGPLPHLVTREASKHGNCYALTNPGHDSALELLNKMLAQA